MLLDAPPLPMRRRAMQRCYDVYAFTRCQSLLCRATTRVTLLPRRHVCCRRARHDATRHVFLPMRAYAAHAAMFAAARDVCRCQPPHMQGLFAAFAGSRRRPRATFTPTFLPCRAFYAAAPFFYACSPILAPLRFRLHFRRLPRHAAPRA